MTAIRHFRPADAPRVAEIITRCLREVNARDYPSEIIDRMCAHFTPARMIELAGEREIYVAVDAKPSGEAKPGSALEGVTTAGPGGEVGPGVRAGPAVGMAEGRSPAANGFDAGIAVTGPVVTGSVVVGTVSRDGNRVFTMFVDPDRGGRGLGSLLVGHIEALAASEGYDHMETGASVTAHDFYRKRGYVDVRESETDFGRNYILRKPLTPPAGL